MLERRVVDGQLDDFYARSLSALDKALAAFERTPDAHVQDIGQARFRRNLFARYTDGDARLSWNEVMLASAAFSRTLRDHKKHLFEDDAFIAFLTEQAVYAAERDGIVVENATVLQPQLPGMDETHDIHVQAQVDSVRQNALPNNATDEKIVKGDPKKPEVGPSAEILAIFRSTTTQLARRSTTPIKESKQRRRLLKWMGLGIAAAATGKGFISGSNYLKAEYERLHPYEVEHRLTSELTPLSSDTRIQFAYPQVDGGWDFTNKYGNRAIVTLNTSGESLSSSRLEVAMPWDNSSFPNVKRAILQEISVNTYTDSSGKLVPKISYYDSEQRFQEYVLIGHLTAPEGSYARERPDVIEIHSQSSDVPLHVSMVAEEVQERGRTRKKQVIKITTFEKTPKTE